MLIGTSSFRRFVRRGVERHGQADREGCGGELADAGDDPDRGHGQAARPETEVAVDALDGRPQVVEVGQRLAHAHEDDVGESSGTGRRTATATCSRISPARRWRRNPDWPVAQKLHAMAHPACSTRTPSTVPDSASTPSRSGHRRRVGRTICGSGRHRRPFGDGLQRGWQGRLERLAQRPGRSVISDRAEHPTVEAVPHLTGAEGRCVAEQHGQVLLALVVGAGHVPRIGTWRRGTIGGWLEGVRSSARWRPPVSGLCSTERNPGARPRTR